MKIGDKVSYTRYNGVIVIIDSSREVIGQPGYLVEFETETSYAWSGAGSVALNQSSIIKKILKEDRYYYWHYDNELTVADVPDIKMISGVNYTQCNTYNKYMELPEEKVSSWVCTPCKS